MDGVQTCALPICLQDLLNQIVINQKDLHLMFQNTQNINLQSFNSILEMQNLGFQATEENLKEIFSKKIGRASCRERVCQCVDLGGRRIIKKKKKNSRMQEIIICQIEKKKN